MSVFSRYVGLSAASPAPVSLSQFLPLTSALFKAFDGISCGVATFLMILAGYLGRWLRVVYVLPSMTAWVSPFTQ